MTAPSFLASFLDPLLLFLSEDPVLRIIQGSIILFAVVIIFLVFFATRDMLRRSHSFWLVALAILLVAALPVVGFLLYLIIRPTETIRQREADRVLRDLHDEWKQRRKHRLDLPKTGRKQHLPLPS